VVAWWRSKSRRQRIVSDRATRRILASMGDGLVVCDAAGKVEFVNDAFCTMCGRSRDDLVGKSTEKVLGLEAGAPADGPWARQVLEDKLVQLPTAAGETLEVRVSMSPLGDGDGALEGAVVLMRDVHESRRTQRELAESRRQLAETRQLARCGHWTWPAGSDLVSGSDELFRMFGLSSAASMTIWRQLWRCFSHADRRALRAVVEKALGDGDSDGGEGAFEHEARIRRAHGDERLVRIRGQVLPAEAGAGPATLAGTVQDVTELREGEETLRSLRKAFETTQVGIAIADLDGTILYVNPAEAALHGYRVDELVGANVSVLAPPELRQPLGIEALRQVRRYRRETVNLHRDGREFAVELTSDVLTDATDTPTGVVTSCLDITERKKTEARFENLLESTPDPMVIVDDEGRIALVNGRVEQELGYERHELLGQPVEILLPERQRGGHPLFRAQYLADPVSRPMGAGLELFCRRKDGSEFPVDISLSPAREEEGLLVIAAIRDVTERKRLEQELVHHAFYDSLTGLPNRALLTDRLQVATQKVRQGARGPFALLCVGLDAFDAVASSLGTKAGDELLTTCADRLAAYALGSDTVARISDDVFVLVMEGLGGIADATRLADRLLRDLGQSVEVAGQAMFVGASAGVVLAGADYRSGDDVLRDAETAMRRARRRQGPGRYEVFDPAMHERAVQRLELETELRFALERAELVLEYQPIVAVGSGKVTGAEALIRWHHPRRGVLGPSTLLPLAEETGLILSIGRFALEEACRQNLAWQSDGLAPLFVAVNLSALQFRQRELPAEVRGVLREVGLEPERLALELTETVLMEDTGFSVDSLDALAETGVGLCVDDFGVGYSSLSYLQRFPMSTLKIDRSFIDRLSGEGPADSMTASIIGLAHNLGLKAVAEGVESEDQLAVLQSQGCDEFQGHYFSPSVSGDRFAQLLRA
jgi:PAS domain S-box-containing protein/diguanylate cyclase (GGDEF)-like protein